MPITTKEEQVRALAAVDFEKNPASDDLITYYLSLRLPNDYMDGDSVAHPVLLKAAEDVCRYLVTRESNARQIGRWSERAKYLQALYVALQEAEATLVVNSDNLAIIVNEVIDQLGDDILDPATIAREIQAYLTANPITGEENVQSDWDESDTTDDAYILNKPSIPDISGLATEADLTIEEEALTDHIANHPQNAGTGEANVQVDWNEADATDDAFILNKPDLSLLATEADLTTQEDLNADRYTEFGNLETEFDAHIANHPSNGGGGGSDGGGNAKGDQLVRYTVGTAADGIQTVGQPVTNSDNVTIVLSDEATALGISVTQNRDINTVQNINDPAMIGYYIELEQGGSVIGTAILPLNAIPVGARTADESFINMFSVGTVFYGIHYENRTGNRYHISPYVSAGTALDTETTWIISKAVVSAGDTNVQSDWNEADTTDDAYILNKPDLSLLATEADLTTQEDLNADRYTEFGNLETEFDDHVANHPGGEGGGDTVVDVTDGRLPADPVQMRIAWSLPNATIDAATFGADSAVGTTDETVSPTYPQAFRDMDIDSAILVFWAATDAEPSELPLDTGEVGAVSTALTIETVDGLYWSTVDPVSRFFQDIPFSLVFPGEALATQTWTTEQIAAIPAPDSTVSYRVVGEHTTAIVADTVFAITMTEDLPTSGDMFIEFYYGTGTAERVSYTQLSLDVLNSRTALAVTPTTAAQSVAGVIERNAATGVGDSSFEAYKIWRSTDAAVVYMVTTRNGPVGAQLSVRTY